jgi:hypothetical protein
MGSCWVERLKYSLEGAPQPQTLTSRLQPDQSCEGGGTGGGRPDVDRADPVSGVATLEDAA